MRKARAIREGLGWSQRDVESDLGLDRGRLSRFERGELMRYPALKALAEHYRVTIDELLEEIEEPVETK